MTTLVWGAGAIGATIGAYAHRAGHDVTLVDVEASHVDAMRRSGLTIEGPVDTFTAHVPAYAPHELSGPYDAVLLCTKAQHTPQALDAIEPLLAPSGYVASFQNGLNEWTVRDRVGPDRTIGAFVNFGADYLGPGRIHFGGRGTVAIGELDGRTSDRLVSLHALVRTFDPATRITDNVWGYLWGKMGYGAMLFASALTNESIADVLDARDVRPLLDALAAEVLQVAQVEGVIPFGFNGFDPVAFGPAGNAAMRAASYDAMVTHNRGSAKTHSGVWRDLAVRKRRTEIDAQFGPIVTRAQAAGRATPTLARLIDVVHDVEEGRRPQAWDTLHALADVPEVA